MALFRRCRRSGRPSGDGHGWSGGEARAVAQAQQQPHIAGSWVLSNIDDIKGHRNSNPLHRQLGVLGLSREACDIKKAASLRVL